MNKRQSYSAKAPDAVDYSGAAAKLRLAGAGAGPWPVARRINRVTANLKLVPFGLKQLVEGPARNALLLAQLLGPVPRRARAGH